MTDKQFEDIQAVILYVSASILILAKGIIEMNKCNSDPGIRYSFDENLRILKKLNAQSNLTKEPNE